MADKTEYKLNIPAGGLKEAAIPLLGQVEKTSKEGVYAVKEHAIVNRQYLVICPVCKKPILVKSSEPRVGRAMHKTCNAPIIIKFVDTASQGEEVQNADNRQTKPGTLQTRMLFSGARLMRNSPGGHLLVANSLFSK